jgi:rod shape determining protein RodA
VITIDMQRNPGRRGGLFAALHIDLQLLIGLLLLASLGLVILYSASNENMDVVFRQLTRLGVATLAMLLFAQFPPRQLHFWAPWLFGIGLALLVAVLVLGEGKGATRWLDLGFVRFQPSEIIKIAVPMMVAWYFSEAALPPRPRRVIIAGVMILVPTLLIAKQPDLGTALLIASSGIFVLLLSGIRWRFVLGAMFTAIAAAPLLWYFMHDYQKRRVLTFLNPENDPLGAGWHIVQSKIAIGSGGLYGKGWLNGTQSHLEFLPERSTDFIFAVYGEEFGLLGVLVMLLLYLFIIGRGLYIAARAQETFGRLLAGSLAITFFFNMFVNIGMVTGLLPVVGMPLPLISYGGTSMVTTMIGFGIIMSVHTHRKLLAH